MKKVISFAETLNKIKMKKPLFVFALFVCSLLQAHQAAAQYKYFVTGSYQNYIYKSDYNASTSVTNTLSPTIGYQLNENWALGATVGMTRDVDKYRDFPNQNKSSIALGLSPFIRYQTPVIGKISVYSDASFGISRVFETGSKANFGLMLESGLLYPILPRLFLTTSLVQAAFNPKDGAFNLYSDGFTALPASIDIKFNYCFNFKKEKN